MRDYARLDAFLDTLAGDVYPEPPGGSHETITEQVIETLVRDGFLRPGMYVLDVGCGQGIALRRFSERGIAALGIGLGGDVRICRDAGFEVVEMDQSFLDLAPGSFDFIWARHVLEHSPFPLFTLAEYRRVLRAGGMAYVEVPAPDTDAHHERNPNHYTVLAQSAWISLFGRAGLPLAADPGIFHMTLPPAGTDFYFAFLLRKAADA